MTRACDVQSLTRTYSRTREMMMNDVQNAYAKLIKCHPIIIHDLNLCLQIVFNHYHWL